MKVLSVPGNLRLVSILTLMAIPLVAIQVALVARAPWWNLPSKAMGVWGLAVALIAFPLSHWLTQGKRAAIVLASLCAVAWTLVSVWLAIRTRNPSLGFFWIVLLVFVIAVLAWGRFEISRSFFDPQMAWYQGVPQPIPGLICHVYPGDKRTYPMKACRFDRDGVFVFGVDQLAAAAGGMRNADGSVRFPQFKKGQRVAVDLLFRGYRVHVDALPRTVLEGGTGAGLQFVIDSPDLKKDLNDFVEALRGEGYAG